MGPDNRTHWHQFTVRNPSCDPQTLALPKGAAWPGPRALAPTRCPSPLLPGPPARPPTCEGHTATLPETRM